MPDRLDRVTVALNRGDVFLSWASRGVLLERLRDVDERRMIRFSFTSVDGSLPVKLTRPSAPTSWSSSMSGPTRCRKTSSSSGTR